MKMKDPSMESSADVREDVSWLVEAVLVLKDRHPGI